MLVAGSTRLAILKIGYTQFDKILINFIYHKFIKHVFYLSFVTKYMNPMKF